ncbi:MAG: hypothetical protein ABIJ30_06645 [bacterium]
MENNVFDKRSAVSYQQSVKTIKSRKRKIFYVMAFCFSWRNTL